MKCYLDKFLHQFLYNFDYFVYFPRFEKPTNDYQKAMQNKKTFACKTSDQKYFFS